MLTFLIMSMCLFMYVAEVAALEEDGITGHPTLQQLLEGMVSKGAG